MLTGDEHEVHVRRMPIKKPNKVNGSIQSLPIFKTNDNSVRHSNVDAFSRNSLKSFNKSIATPSRLSLSSYHNPVHKRGGTFCAGLVEKTRESSEIA
jgi:hypothetical protein